MELKQVYSVWCRFVHDGILEVERVPTDDIVADSVRKMRLYLMTCRPTVGSSIREVINLMLTTK